MSWRWGLRAFAVLSLMVALVLPFAERLFVASVGRLSHSKDPAQRQFEVVSQGALREQWAGKRALVVGGTRGIGRGISLNLARCGASVVIVGRSKDMGEAVVEEMNSLSSGEQAFRFQQADLFTVRGLEAFLDSYSHLERESGDAAKKLDFLVLTVGTWPHAVQPKTDDGLDKVIALDVLARFTVIRGLAPMLEKARGTVLSVLASTTKVFPPSVETMKMLISGQQDSSGLLGIHPMLSTAATAGDAVLVQGSKLYPAINFIGTHPGFVISQLTRDTFPPLFNKIKDMFLSLLPVTLSERRCGEIHVQLASQALHSNLVFFNMLGEARMSGPLAYDEDFGNWLVEFLTEFSAEQQTAA